MDYTIQKMASELKEHISSLKLSYEVSDEFISGALEETAIRDEEESIFQIDPNIPNDTRPDFELSTGLDPTLNVRQFLGQLDAALQTGFASFYFELRKEGQTISSRAKEWARFPIDNAEPWNSDRRMHVASITKFITAIAIVQALKERNLDPKTTLIGDFCRSIGNLVAHPIKFHSHNC